MNAPRHPIGTATLAVVLIFALNAIVQAQDNPPPAAAPALTPPAAPAAPAAPENPAAAPDHLDTLAQQAPNAVAWVLAPLDAAVPPDIRQNLTYLREALLDEAAKKPAAIPDAYKVGEQICNAMIGSLDERDRTRARAGFRAVEAQTRTGVSSEALDARRTSSPGKRMNWPVFDREQAQRDELKSQAVNKAAVIAERPKLEWSQRADQIRPMLDALYKQFREALRKSPGRSVMAVAPVISATSSTPPVANPPGPAPAIPTPHTGASANANFTISKVLTNSKWTWYDRTDRAAATLTFHNDGKISATRNSWQRWEPVDSKKFKVFNPVGKFWVFEFDAEKSEARTTQGGTLSESRVMKPVGK